MILERTITADLSLFHTHVGDSERNLRCWLTAENFSPLVVMCGKATLAEVESLSEVYLDPEMIGTPGVFIDRLFQLTTVGKFIEKQTVRRRPGDSGTDSTLVDNDQDR